MGLRIIILMAVLLSFTPSVFAQAKVGTTGGNFLNIVHDVRAVGMGHAGVALTDNYSGYFNPAVMAMINSEKRFKMAFGYLDMVAEIDVTHLSLAAKIIKPHDKSGSGFHLGAGFYMVNLNTGEMSVTTYQQGTQQGSGQIFSADEISYNLSVGAGFSTIFDISTGMTVKYLIEKFNDEEANGPAFDFGLLVSKGFKDYINENTNWIFRPSFGISFTNQGPDMKMVEKEYHLPKKMNIGLAFEFAREKSSNTESWRQFSIMPLMEIEDYLEGADGSNLIAKAGIEVGLFDAVCARIGNYESEAVDFTWGFGLNSQGLVRLLGGGNSSSGSIAYFFREKMLVEFNYARDEMTYFPDNIYYGLNISF